MEKLKNFIFENIKKISFKMIEEGNITTKLSLRDLDLAIEDLREDEALKILQGLQNKKVAYIQNEDDYVYVLKIK